MAIDRVERKLAAILAADMVGYSRLIGADEEDTIARQKAHRAELIYVMKKHHEQAIAEARCATSLDPNFAEGYARLGEILNLAGRPEEGIDLIKKAMRLDPQFPPNYLIYLGHAYFAMGKYEEAIVAMKRSLIGNANFLTPHRSLAAIFSELGRTEEAQAEVAEILRINPRASLESQRERMAFNDQAVSEKYLENLRKAGLPD